MDETIQKEIIIFSIYSVPGAPVRVRPGTPVLSLKNINEYIISI